MKITFLGATGQVTGSCYLVENTVEKFLVDFGLYQGTSNDHLLNSEMPEFDPNSINFMLLTHAHIDHCGRIPLLVKKGFKGKIYCTKATAHLAEILLLDSAKILESEIIKENEKRLSAGLDSKEPLFSKDDVYESLQYFYPVEYNSIIEETNIEIKFINAGHLLGSASIVVTDKVKNQKICFSGDIGSGNNSLLNSPTFPESVDILITESTYGNRLHKDVTFRMDILSKTIEHLIDQNNVILIPAFAVGRVQELTYELIKYYKDGNRIEKFLSTDIYIDSPLGDSAKKIFMKEHSYLNSDLSTLIEKGTDPFKFKNIKYVEDTKESIFLSKNKNPKVIIASSGMCDGGRVVGHLKELLPYDKATILFVGYQGDNTNGRVIQSGKSELIIDDKTIEIKSSKITLSGFSGHGDRDMIIHWITENNKNAKKIFITHGEDDAREDFKNTLSSLVKSNIIIPKVNESFEL